METDIVVIDLYDRKSVEEFVELVASGQVRCGVSQLAVVKILTGKNLF